jgi:hypothetical protein
MPYIYISGSEILEAEAPLAINCTLKVPPKKKLHIQASLIPQNLNHLHINLEHIQIK